MIGVLAVAAYFGSVAWTFHEVTRQPQREGLILLSMALMILMAVITGNIITGGE